MKTNLNLLQVVGAIVFVFWTMGKVPYGVGAWLIPFGIGALINALAVVADRLNLTEK